MKTITKLKIESLECKRLVRLVQVGAKHYSRLPSFGGKLLDSLTTTIGDLKAMVVSQQSAASRAKEMLNLKGMARNALRLDMEAICRAARVIALDLPEFEPSRFQIPKSGDDKLLTKAKQAANEAVALSTAFVDHGLPQDFLGTLNAHITSLEQTTHDLEESLLTYAAITKNIRTALEEAMLSAKRFDAIVRNVLVGDSNALAEWGRACRFGRAKPQQAVTEQVPSKIQEGPPAPADTPPGKEEKVIAATPVP